MDTSMRSVKAVPDMLPRDCPTVEYYKANPHDLEHTPGPHTSLSGGDRLQLKHVISSRSVHCVICNIWAGVSKYTELPQSLLINSSMKHDNSQQSKYSLYILLVAVLVWWSFVECLWDLESVESRQLE
ncbi:hypothetical protein J6590_024541 [Homalodisca vitripennis]|nr:hypothetical protein J6590_024541 [Homalodisca vitripennis]